MTRSCCDCHPHPSMAVTRGWLTGRGGGVGAERGSPHRCGAGAQHCASEARRPRHCTAFVNKTPRSRTHAASPARRSQAPALTHHSTESRAEPRATQPNTRSRLLTPRNLNCPRSPRPAGRLADPADGQTRISTVRGLPCRAAEIRSARKRKRDFARRTEEQRHLEQAPKETHAEQAPGSSPPRAHGSAAAGHVGGCW